MLGFMPKCSPLHSISKAAFSELDKFSSVGEVVRFDAGRSRGKVDDGGESASSGFGKMCMMRAERKSMLIGDAIVEDPRADLLVQLFLFLITRILEEDGLVRESRRRIKC